MSVRKRKGSGRPKLSYPPYAIGPEQALEAAMQLADLSDRNIEKIMKVAVKNSESGPKLVSSDTEDEESKRTAVSADLYAHNHNLNAAAVRRELDMRGYYCFPIKDIRADAMTRLISNTNCECEENNAGMLQIFRITHGETEVTVIVDRYSGVLNMMCTAKRLYNYDEFARNLTEYFAAAGIFKNYTSDIKVFMKDETETDPMTDCDPMYPAVWMRGAYPEDIEHIRNLSDWYKGLVHFYVTPLAAGTMPREIHIKNVFGSENPIIMPLADSESDYASLILKAVLDSDRMYKSTLNAAKSNAAFKINVDVGEDGLDIKSFPLFKKPTKEAEVTGPFITDNDGLNEILNKADQKDVNTDEKLDSEEVKELKTRLKGEELKNKTLTEGFENIKKDFDKLKKTAETEADELGKELQEVKEKLLESEANEQELKAKVAEYAGLLRDQKETDEYEQILKESENENAELRKKIAELQTANEALTSNFEALKKRDVKGETLITRGEEKDFFMGEIKDFILSAVAKELEACEPETRRAHVMQDILNANNYEHLLENKRSRLKVICGRNGGDLAAALPELRKEGYYVKSYDAHPKVEYYGDPRYTSVVSSTASDHRSGLNQISDMARTCL